LKTDPARFEVVKNALCSAAEAMKIVLAKTAYSPLLKVAGVYSFGIFDIAGNMVAQGPDLPIHPGSMPDAVCAVLRAFRDVVPSDMFIDNDPHDGGSRLPDVNVVAPAFHDGRVLGVGCVRAH
jgi:N-methylhydantoinase B